MRLPRVQVSRQDGAPTVPPNTLSCLPGPAVVWRALFGCSLLCCRPKCAMPLLLFAITVAQDNATFAVC